MLHNVIQCYTMLNVFDTIAIAQFTSVLPHRVAVQDVSVVLNDLMAAAISAPEERVAKLKI